MNYDLLRESLNALEKENKDLKQSMIPKEIKDEETDSDI